MATLALAQVQQCWPGACKQQYLVTVKLDRAGQGGAAQAINTALQPASRHGTVDSPSSSRAPIMNPTPPFFCRQQQRGERDVSMHLDVLRPAMEGQQHSMSGQGGSPVSLPTWWQGQPACNSQLGLCIQAWVCIAWHSSRCTEAGDMLAGNPGLATALHADQAGSFSSQASAQQASGCGITVGCC